MTSAGKKDGKDAAQFIRNFCDFLGDTEDLKSEEIKAELIAEGVDIDKLVTNVQTMVKVRIAESKRAWLKEAPAKRAEILNRLQSMAPEKTLNIAEIREKVKQLISTGTNREFAVAFKNYDHLSDDDLRKLYSDYLKLLSLKKITDEK